MIDINEKLRYPLSWLVTGAAGFIGSHLVEYLLKNNQKVIGLDNLSTGNINNLNLVQDSVNKDQWKSFKFHEGDVCNFNTCLRYTSGVDYVLHQAALGSVNRSIDDPISTNYSNVNGFLNILYASKNNDVKRVVFASSSSVYGSSLKIPKSENEIGKPLSPYALTKIINEEYAQVFSEVYGTEWIGLRYFNVFGERQNPNGDYAAVIPRWIKNLIHNREIEIFGDGLTSRDFCYVRNAVNANILSALSDNKKSVNQVYNISANRQTTLNELFEMISFILARKIPNFVIKPPFKKDFRLGDVRHSLADISKSVKLLGYRSEFDISDGLEKTIDWFLQN